MNILSPDYEELAGRSGLSIEEITLMICGINPDLNVAGSYGAFSGPPPHNPEVVHISSQLSKQISIDKKHSIKEVHAALLKLRLKSSFVKSAEIITKLKRFKYPLPKKYIEFLNKNLLINIDKDKELSERKENNIKKAIGLLSISLAIKSRNKYYYGEGISASKITADLTDLAKELGIDIDGIKRFDRYITDSIHYLHEHYGVDIKTIKDKIK